jgi:hypothetical protein
MCVQLLYNIEYALAVPQLLIDINVCDPQDIIVTWHWHDSAFHIGQKFLSFIVHCSAHRTQNAVAGVDVLKFASVAGNATIRSDRQSRRSRGLYTMPKRARPNRAKAHVVGAISAEPWNREYPHNYFMQSRYLSQMELLTSPWKLSLDRADDRINRSSHRVKQLAFYAERLRSYGYGTIVPGSGITR